MTKRIFRSICLAAFIVFAATVALIMGVLYEYFSRMLQEQLKIETNLAAQGAANEGISFFQDLRVSNYRITWIAVDGTVLYDSQSKEEEMENHLEREEVREAFSKGFGESRRYSSTLLTRSLYAAQKLPDGTILRLSVSQSSVLTLLFGMIQPICMVFVIALILAIVLAIRLSEKIVKPLDEVDLENPLSHVEYDELAPFLRRIDSQHKQLRRQKEELLRKENELHTIIGSMNEGMVLLDQKGKIISINPAAKRLLETDAECVGMDMLSLCRNLDLQKILTDALQGKQGGRTISFHGESYRVDANPIISEKGIEGAALFFFNVTQREKAEQIRREFTANVSHELKTPLHSISGYAELLKNHMVKENDTAQFGEKIYGEAQRMIQLVEDIISLSHLDEGAEDMDWESVDFCELAERAIKSLKPEADAAGVSLTLSGTAVKCYGIPQLLYSMVYNLCDNAVKYNREGGEVFVEIHKEGRTVVLSVKDTGIGIAPEDRGRIFERFYRVDKSRSKAVGGTGLGLSIVKHAAKIHHAGIEVKSVVGEGTQMIVTFAEQM